MIRALMFLAKAGLRIGSFIAERNHGVDSGSTSRGAVACKHGYKQQEWYGAGKADRVCALEAVEHVGNQAVCRKGERNSDNDASVDRARFAVKTRMGDRLSESYTNVCGALCVYSIARCAPAEKSGTKMTCRS